MICRHCKQLLKDNDFSEGYYDCEKCNFAIFNSQRFGYEVYYDVDNIGFHLKEFFLKESYIVHNHNYEQINFEGFKDLDFHKKRLKHYIKCRLLK